MNRRTFINLSSASALGVWAGLPFVKGATGPMAEGSVTIYPDREIGRIDKKIYGHFLEHLENVIYDGIYDPKSPKSDKMGLREDVITAIKEMGGAQVLRWPGGNFASYYHWKDGIGPKKSRPQRFDVVFENKESNHMGTDEYLALCRKLECEPFITANMGSGSIEEACQWVEYCRHQNRQPPVRIWGLGNEHFGPWQVGYYTAEEYGRKAQQYAQFMRAVQKDLQFVGVGYTEPAWNETVLQHCGHSLEWLSIHMYAHRDFMDGKDDFDRTVAMPVFFEKEMREMADTIENWERKSNRKEPLKICFEEWNSRHLKNEGQLDRQSPRNITDALFTAGVFNVCQRMADRVTMSNFVFLINTHAPIVVKGDQILRSATFDVFRLYATRSQPVSVQADAQSVGFSADIKPIGNWGQDNFTLQAKRLDVSATRSVDGKKMTVFLSNLEKEKPMSVRLNIAGQSPPESGVLHTVGADSVLTVNTLAEPNKVRSVTKNISNLSQPVELPPHSVNVLEISLG